MKKQLTLCMVQQQEKILLGMKKRGFGAGRWNGFGGKVEPDETIVSAAARETFEEVGITVQNLCKKGIIQFSFIGQPEVLEVHIFKTDTFTGDPKESDEMKPQWFSVKEIPFEEMWSDDKYWLPLLLEDKNFKGKFHFGINEEVLEYELNEV